MATNKYFNFIDQKQEQDLFEDLVIEAVQINGVDVVYIPREVTEIDDILRESRQAIFNKYHVIEAFMPDTGQLGGDGYIMGKFGYQIEQTTELQISKRRWEELGTGFSRPREGDLIYIGDISSPGSSKNSFINTFFQINQVWFNDPDWQFGKHFVYKLFCKTYIHSHEKFETGNTEIDQMNKEAMDDITTGINEASKRMSDEILVNRDNPFGDF